MTPLSVLRIWSLGLLGWALLAAGLYLLWEWADGVDPLPAPPARVEPAAPGAEADGPPAEARPAPRTAPAAATRSTDSDDLDRQGGWPYLLGGLALVLLSSGGAGLPIVLAITLTRKEPRYDDRGTRQTVSRPDGSRLHVVVDGPPDGPTLIFSHGWGLSSGDWYYVKRDLAARYRIMTWDLAGLGHSTRANDGDQSLEKMADDLAAVLDATCPAGPAILVGHSIGGMITQVFCRRHAARLGTSVVGLVLAETTYINPLRTAVGAPLWKALEKPLIVPLNYLTIGLAPLAWISNWQSYLNGSMHLSSRLTSFAGRQTLGQVDYLSLLLACAWPATSARGNLAMLTLDTTDVLPTIPVPVLVVAGWHDLLTRHQAGVEMARLIPGAELVTLDPGGHMGHWENHPDFLPALTAFVDRISKTTT